MNYEFPNITHIDDVKHLVENFDSDFFLKEKENFDVIDYQVAFGDTFPPINTNDDAIKREFRGLIFDKEGNLIRRPYHKFFNVNERDETKNIDLSHAHTILEKLDGSMICFFLIDDESYWGTKLASEEFHQDVKKFVKESEIDYDAFCRKLYKKGYNPIFEWISPNNRIVVKYKEPQLIVTAIRHIVTGAYMPYETVKGICEDHGIPCVKAYEGNQKNMEDLIKHTSLLEQEEGYVIVFADGHRVKIKGEWYCHLHKVKSYFDYEKDIAKLCLMGDCDDILSMVDEDDRIKLENYEHDLSMILKKYVQDTLFSVCCVKYKDMTRKEFSLSRSHLPPVIRACVFNNWDRLESVTSMQIHEGMLSSFLNASSYSHNKWADFKKKNYFTGLEW
ncbi:MAG: hypothetical protein COA52_00390 [Hyphomicrobiales bacterium]|nr:MAG: hypothetical protein COA52_00390 [Hyphomicrobiales bacterium]